MKHLKTTTAVLAIAFLTLTTVSCKEGKKEQSATEEQLSEMGATAHGDEHHNMNSDSETASHEMASMKQEATANGVMASYMVLKDALVADNKEGAAAAGASLAKSLSSFDASAYTKEEQTELSEILEASIEHAEHIVKSDIKHQREHFKSLSNDLIDMVAITGTEVTLYKQFCPMYDKGSAWLSNSKEIRNPYHGSKMLKCGSVKAEIN
jgi:hypothetical protein